jgi:26S proteasome non-ATPase regulatory subunit 10
MSYPNFEVDIVDDTNATPLVLATLGGHLETVKMLLAKGANINHKNWQGHSAFQVSIVKFLLMVD